MDNGDGPVVLIRARARPRSIHYRPLLEPVTGDGVRALDWCVERIRAALGHPTYLLVSTCDAGYAVRRPTRVVRSKYVRDLEVLLDAAARLRATRAFFVYPEVAFAPPLLLQRLEAVHEANGQASTLVHGLPPFVTPLAVDVAALRALLALPWQPPPSSPHELVHRGREAAAASGGGLAFESAVLDAASIPGLEGHDVPCRLALETSDDIRIARRAVVSERPLQAWRGAAIEERTRYFDAPRLVARARVRVLYVTNPSALTGAEVVLADTIRHVDRTRVDPVALVAYDGELTSRLRRDGITVRCPNREMGNAEGDTWRFVVDTLRELEPDIVHCNGNSGLPIVFGAAALGIPVITHVHVSHLNGWGPNLRASAHIIAVSPHLVPAVMNHEVDARHITVVSPGVDSDFFRPPTPEQRARARHDLGLGSATPVIGMVARFANGKRHDVLLRAAAELKDTCPDLMLLLVGETFADESSLSAVASLAARAGLSKHVRFPGFQQDMRPVYASMDVAALPSDAEGFGLAILEAMAMSVPVVATRTPAVERILQGGRYGELVPRSDASGFARSLRRAIDAGAGDSRTLAARRRVETDHSLAASASCVMKVYEDVLGGRPPERRRGERDEDQSDLCVPGPAGALRASR